MKIDVSFHLASNNMSVAHLKNMDFFPYRVGESVSFFDDSGNLGEYTIVKIIHGVVVGASKVSAIIYIG